MPLWQTIAQAVGQIQGITPGTPQAVAIGGGCINQAFRLNLGNGAEFFVKLNQAGAEPMFEAERDGLEALARSAIRVPKPICCGATDGMTYLVLEYLPLRQRGDQALAGRQLAQLHRITHDRFGWWRNNHIGATPQSNAWCDDWPRFWAEQRLQPQLQLARQQGYHGELQRLGAQITEALPKLLGHSPPASLLHGDLWSGNLAYDTQGNPVIYDPAVYYGDREADLAMTELFGGFSDAFYAAYRETWPLPAGYGLRKQLYNLYHILNHLNLFGSGYLGQAQSCMQGLMTEI